MLNGNHVKFVMGIIGILNEDKKKRGYKFKTDEEILAIEKKVISLVNKWNSIENFFINNKISLFIKEKFQNIFGTKYPEYLYNDILDDYLSAYSQGWVKGYYTIFGVRVNAPVLVSQISTSPEVTRAIDISKLNFIKRFFMISGLKKAVIQNGISGEYRIKRVITYEKTE